MRLLLNVVWFVLAGLWMALAYALAALIWPFGKTVVRRPDAGFASALGNVLWFVFCGWWLALGHLVTGVALCLTIVGLPLGLANFKLIPVSLVPLGRAIVDIDDARRTAAVVTVAVPADPSSPPRT